jgi:two-component system, NtrC family, sensor kinase
VNDTALDIRQANCLYQIGRMLIDDYACQAVLDAIARAAHDLTGAHAAVVALIEGDGLLSDGQPLANDDVNLAMEAIRGGRSVVYDDPKGTGSPEDARTLLAVPLIWHAEPLGVLTVSFLAQHAASAEIVGLVSALAEQAAAAVKHSRDDAAMLRLRAESEEVARQFAEHSEQLERVQLQLIQNEKLTAIGQLIQGFAHDINTPLSVVITNLSVLKGHTENLGGIAQAALDVLPALQANPDVVTLVGPLDAAVRGADLEYTLEDLPDLVNESTAAARRIAELVRSIANFARRDDSAPRLVEIRDVLESALTLASSPLKQVALTVREYTKTPPVFGLFAELNELFVHLLINAANALESRPGTLTVSTAHEDDKVVVRISDTGCGIPVDNLVHVFDPFFSTHAAGGSTGMGLAVCHGIVARHAGSIALESEADKGTTVTINLPAAHHGRVAA